MSKLETAEEALVVDWCKRHDVETLKLTLMGNRGWPDRIFIFPKGTHVWIEFKRKGKKPRRLQVHRLEQLNLKGVNAYWYDSAEGAIKTLNEHLIRDKTL